MSPTNLRKMLFSTWQSFSKTVECLPVLRRATHSAVARPLHSGAPVSINSGCWKRQAGRRHLYLRHRIKTSSETDPAFYRMVSGSKVAGAWSDYSHLTPGLRMRGSKPPLLHKSSLNWRGRSNSHLLTGLFTPPSRVLLEKLTGSKLVKKFPAFYGTRRFITVLTSARHLSLSSDRYIQSPQPPPTSWRSILISSSHLRLGLPSRLFPSGFPTKTPCAPLLSPHTHYMPSPSHSSRFYHPNNTGWAVQITRFLNMQFYPLSCYLVPLRPKYYLEHPILRHPQPTFLPQCERPYFTHIQNNRQNYSSILYIS
jgi:hypothetical protein